ncbi:hypothetical protein DV738_g243, partial [Chaetothyriales sp. CBS 135597]
MADSEAIFEDYSHQGCYVFQPSAANGVDSGERDHDINNYHEDDGHAEDGDIDDRPRKRQKSRRSAIVQAEDKSQEPELKSTRNVWPRLCAGTEPEELAVLRRHTYGRLWEAVEERIDAVIDAVDGESLAKIRHFVRSVVPPKGQLTTALLLSGAQGRRQMQQLLRHWSQGSTEAEAEAELHSEVFIQLPAHQCPNLPTALKTLIRLAINSHSVSPSTDHYAAFVAANKRLIPMAFDLELLHRYLVQQGLSRIVVALPEIESFDVSLFADLVHHLSLWSDRIPFALVLGVSTTIDLFESRLPKATIRLLHAQPFSLSPHADPLYPILQAIHKSPTSGLFLGASVLGFLAESTHNQSTSPSALKRIIKHAFMSHFFANPLSTLLCDKTEHPTLHKTTNQSFLASLLRNTPSFRAHCSDLLHLKTKDAAERIRQLLTSDSDILDHAISSLTASTDRLRSAYTAIDAFVQLYTYPALGLNTPPTPASELYVQLSQHLMPGPKTRAFQTTTLFSDLKSTLTAAHQISDIINDLNTFPPEMTSCDSLTDLLALFYRALAELKMLGLVQHASTSTFPSVGAAASARSARVDIVARSTWPGL